MPVGENSPTGYERCLMQDLTNKFRSLRSEYGDVVEKIVPLMPALLAIADFNRTGNFSLVVERSKIGYYGTIVNGTFVPPNEGPYSGFMNSISSDDIKKFKELVHIEKEI